MGHTVCMKVIFCNLVINIVIHFLLLTSILSSINFCRAPPQPIVQESSHPYTDDITLNGHVRIPGAEALRIEFDRQVPEKLRTSVNGR